MREEQQPILTFDDLWLGYAPGEYLLKQASDQVYNGEMIALAGRNGTGKSTLLRTIAGIQKPVRGNITLNNRPLSAFSAREFAKKISFVGTGTGLVENLTVFEMVSLGRHPYTNWWGNIRDKDRRKIHESIRFVGMEDFTEARVNRLSDGERQRVMIAMALAQDTRIMILDEPTAFLDIPNRIGILEVLNKLKKQGRTVLFSTHEFDNIFSYADKVWVIDQQQLLSGSPEDLGIKGAYEQVFSDAGIAFDRENLKFLKKGAFDRNIVLIGDEEALLFWTRRALERGGYHVSVKKQEEGSTGSTPGELYVTIGRMDAGVITGTGRNTTQRTDKDTARGSGNDTVQGSDNDIVQGSVNDTVQPSSPHPGKETSADLYRLNDTAPSWKVRAGDTTRTFHTLYDLMGFLTHID